MRYALVVSAVVFILGLFGASNIEAQTCAEIVSRSSGTHKFRGLGERLEILLRPGDAVSSDSDEVEPSTECYPLSLELRWANGRNNGSNFQILVLDGRDQTVYARGLSGFLVGTRRISLTGAEAQQWPGHNLISVPSKIVIQTKPPLALPASLSYSVTWLESSRRSDEREVDSAAEKKAKERTPKALPPEEGTGNQVVGIRSVVRLIGSSRWALVQIELRSAVPLPVREVPLKLRIGDQVFLDELAGEYTGRNLTLSLTPKMFADLEDGAEIKAFYDERESWSFGKLSKSLLAK
ncbi:MAG TPA: hypothetical protein VJ023_07855 [Pyrinomonadaceae bacterium]|nr:hypothetical protein [Pyrinomonadaceae bacterium]